MPVVLDLRPGGYCEAKVGEDFGQFVHHLADRVNGAARGLWRGQGQVDPLGREAPLQRGAFQRRLAGGEGRGNAFAQRMDLRPLRLALLRAHLAQRLEQRRDRALLAEKRDAQLLDRIEVGRGIDPRQRFGPGCCVIHCGSIPRKCLRGRP